MTAGVVLRIRLGDVPSVFKSIGNPSPRCHSKEVTPPLAILRSVRSRISGKGRPLLSARFKIPAQAVGLKENLDGGFGSKMSDSEHTTPPLRHSEELRVKYSPRHTVPELIQGSEQASEILPFLAVRPRAEASGDVLPHSPSRTDVS